MDEIPAELRDFLLRYIDSVAHLEALLLLRGNAEQGWDSAKLAARLYTSPEQAVLVLNELSEQGFAATLGGEYKYTGGSPEQQQTITQLAAFYTSHIVAVTQLIHSRPLRIRAFANAFKLKKDS